MKTIVINGSPKGKNGNTEIFIHNFMKDMKQEVEVKRIIEEDYEELANLVKDYDSIILALPLYIHSMPGIVMRFIEHLEVNNSNRPKYMGFILQCGFPEGFQCKYLESYFESLAIELNMNYLGTLIKPEAAGINVMPKFMTKKLFENLKKFGKIYEETFKFDKEIKEKLKQPYEIKGFKLKLINLAKKLGMMDIMWNKFLRKNKAFEERYQTPYCSK